MAEYNTTRESYEPGMFTAASVNSVRTQYSLPLQGAVLTDTSSDSLRTQHQLSLDAINTNFPDAHSDSLRTQYSVSLDAANSAKPRSYTGNEFGQASEWNSVDSNSGGSESLSLNLNKSSIDRKTQYQDDLTHPKQRYLPDNRSGIEVTTYVHPHQLTDSRMGTVDTDRLSRQSGNFSRDDPTEGSSIQNRIDDRITDDRPVSPQRIDLLKYLELQEFYPGKISLHHVVQIGQPVTESNGGKIAWNILKNLMMLDENALTKESFSSEIPNNEEDDSASVSTLSESENQIHPSDIFMTIFACCDLNLRQILMQKMFQCRLALPFVFPDVHSGELTYNLWGLRTTTLVWRDSSDCAVESSTVDHPINTVSCVRLGRPNISKSKLLNKVISDDSRETFLNMDTPNGDIQRQFTEGLVEASFFLPSGQRKDVLRDPTVFLNLRGDGAQHEKQVDILSQISNVLVVFLDINSLDDNSVIESMKIIHQHGANVLMILGNEFKRSKEDQKIKLEHYKGQIGIVCDENTTKIFTFTSQKEKNSFQTTKEVKDALYKKLVDENGKVLQDASPIMSSKMIRIDEKSKYCQEGKILAQRVMSEKHKDASRTELLPLQGEHWKEWCRLQKSKKRKKKAGEGIQHVGREEEEMNYHRMQQDELCNNISPFMKEFIGGLEAAINSPTMDFYLQWLKIYLDDASRQKLPPLQQRYHEKMTKLRNERRKKHNMHGTCKEEEEKHEIEKKIDDATLGLEHLMREIGQIYEAAIESHNEQHKRFFNGLPDLAADLLLGCHSLEIMDGDASGVPLTWLNAVFDCLKEKIGDEKLFSLSVLGLQSSGKSTLLNTMFGLQFPVSAGRCTRGVYMQLLKVQPSEELPFSYIAILDTEGLRAQKIGDSKYEHDNMLATFIIGLGTLTIINIKGENLSEIKDILQIYVHAFLRMKMVNSGIQKQRSCLFIHQNVSDTNAPEKMRDEQQKSQEQLDQRTRAAAKLENISDVCCFNDVIQFDIQKNVWYFPDLWHGTPPMASVSNEYHEKVKTLKSALLNDFAKDRKGILRISQQQDFIRDMWHGVLADDFVFNFRNSIVTKAYKDLEQKYSELKWELELSMKEWLKSIQWGKDGTQEALKSQCHDLKKKVTDIIHTKRERILQDFKVFINDNAQSDIMHQWKDEKLITMNYAVDTILMSTKQDIDKTGEQTAVTILKDKEQDRHKEEILKKARQLAEKLKDTSSDDDQILKEEFNKMWSEWIDKISNDENLKEIPIKDQLEDLLYEEFPHSGPIVKSELRKRPLLQRQFNESLASSLTSNDVQDIVLQAKESRIKPFAFSKLLYKPEGPAMREIKQLFQGVESHLHALAKKTADFNIHNARAVLRYVREELGRLREDTQVPLSIPNNAEIKLVAMVASYSFKTFEEMQKRYVRDYSVTAQLKAYRNTTLKMFMNVIKQVEDENCVVDVLCEEIEQQVQKVIMGHLELAVVKEVVPHFTTKAKLIKAVLIDLAKRENFQQYQSYIRNSKSYVLGWIGYYIEQHIFRKVAGSSLYLLYATSKIQETVGKIKETIMNTSKNTQGPSVAKHWIEKFSELVSPIITVTGKNALPFIRYRECNFSNLETTFVKCLDKVEGNILKSFGKHTMGNVKWPNSAPQEQIMNSIWGCEAVCPFCKEPCLKSDPKHTSSKNDCHVSIHHRPQGVSDRTWVNSHKLVVENCSYVVQSNATFRCESAVQHICKNNEEFHSYTGYKAFVPNWEIPPSADMHSSFYWMWYITRFQREAAAAVNVQLPDIPPSWYNITKEQAIDGLSEYYG